MPAVPAVHAPIRVVLADDHDLVRLGIGALLADVEGVELVGEASDGQELIALVERLQPDLALTDITMPGVDGLTAVAQIHARWPEVRLVVLSMHNTVDFMKRAVAAGACGYLMKDAPSVELSRAIRTVMETGSYFSPAVTEQLRQPRELTAVDLLTDRQLEVLGMIADGRTSREIGLALGLSPKTVDVHRSRIMQRLAINDVASITRYAIRHGLVKD